MSFAQSVAWWCYEQRGIDENELLREIKSIGYSAVELAPPHKFSLVRDHGLRIAAHQLHVPLEQGLSHPKYWDDIQRQADASLRLAQEWNIPCLICFSGNREGLDDQRGAENAIQHLTQLAESAESAGITLVLELLNSKIDHPDYQCDHTAWGVQVVSAVNSPRARLLYDIYHMQVMEGDIIQTIRDNHQWIAHYHTAGVPGRNEIDVSQELNYSAICRAIAETGFSGYLGQEFLPTGDWKAALRQAFDACNMH
ncbi:MAG: TIM barrel protein [Chloroflexi bacterium]|nr:TIM barrel protein [Chloroflexota bacterium]MCY4246345.1 TIM barrel protein [Chloroflexota bacterium]